MEIERKLGFDPKDREHEKLGYDIESRVPNIGKLRFLEVKGRVTGADTITVTKNEILYSLNKPDDFILAIVEFLTDGGHRTYYLRRPFQREPDFGVTSVNYLPISSRAPVLQGRKRAAGRYDIFHRCLDLGWAFRGQARAVRPTIARVGARGGILPMVSGTFQFPFLKAETPFETQRAWFELSDQAAGSAPKSARCKPMAEVSVPCLIGRMALGSTDIVAVLALLCVLVAAYAALKWP
jgi:hypothetical protein